MKVRDWLGMLFFVPALFLQVIAVAICGPKGRQMIANSYAEAVRPHVEAANKDFDNFIAGD